MQNLPEIDLNTDPVLTYLFKKIGSCSLNDLDEEELTDFLTKFYTEFTVTKNNNLRN